MYQGVNASEGIGIGTVMVAVDPDLTFEPREVSDTAAEKERYQAALREDPGPGRPHEGRRG